MLQAALEKQPVHAFGMTQRVAQGMVWHGVQLQRGISSLKAEIDEHGMTAFAFSERPGEARRDGGGCAEAVLC